MASSSSSSFSTIKVSLPHLAQVIDHSLLHPTLSDANLRAGLVLARDYSVASACIKPYAVPLARSILAGTPVRICTVVGFPHGSSSASLKITEAADAIASGATEIDMVINIGKALGGEWSYVEHEIEAVNRLVTTRGAILKVIFENDFLQDEHIVKLCQVCTDLGVAFVKTSTGYGFVKQPNGFYSYHGATPHHLKLMRKHAGPKVQIKAAGGVRTLDELLYVLTLGVTRVGASATEAILEEARARGIGEAEVEVEVKVPKGLQDATH
ncbi:deoxyribose-phosphate aldolase [Trichoderma cornu-damae]|uniref:deoxyribose-phosphate aldolase n=1 Tax=Trichoderma cornu-damae TaxID=654480 RepID=A0A9P8QIL7_9HYPO|nr:deoxyribose-phosphate aldolase [Trichoderma cornu-damae]